MSIAYRKISITKNDDRGIIKNGDTPIPKNSNIGIIKNGATPIIKNGGDTITRRNNTSRNTTRVFRADAQTLGNGYSQNNFFQEPALSVSPAINVPLEPAGASLPKPKQAKPNRPKEPPLTEREPKNDQDRVIKAYALNFKTLYEQGKVTTPTPVINYGMIGKLIKHHIADNITVEQLTGALNRAMSDTFVLGRGYTFSTILSAGVLNRLINSKATPKWATTPGRSTPVVGPKKIMLML
jgi:hypothetical protein